jgi:uncharacterized Zn-binding protein involved in type VI secretion
MLILKVQLALNQLETQAVSYYNMPQVHRLTDKNKAGAPIVSVIQSSVYVNNLLASVDGSPVAGHGPGVHAGPVTANGSQDVFIEYIPVNRLDDPDSCGHPRAIGSPDVYVNG